LKKTYAVVALAVIGLILVFAIVSFLRENWAADGSPGSVEQWFARLILFQSRKETKSLANPLPPDETTLEAGRQIYERHCAFCHGQDGGGIPSDGMQFYPPVPSLKAPSEPLSDGQIFSIVQLGVRYTAMPGFGKALSEEQIWQVTSFIHSLKDGTKSDNAAAR
jgi:mono/diheme cytochrome c family protein